MSNSRRKNQTSNGYARVHLKKRTTYFLTKLIAFIVLLIFLFPTIVTATNSVTEIVNNVNESTTEKTEKNNENSVQEEFNYPEENKEEEQIAEEGKEEEKTEEKKEVPKEVLEKKPDLIETQKVEGEQVEVDKYSTTYKIGEKTFKKVISTVPNTYTNSEGKEQEIDNTLVKEGGNTLRRAVTGETYTNKSNDFKVSLPKDIKNGTGITVGKDDKKIELIPVEGDFSNSVVQENAIRYNNVLDSIDYQYTMFNTALKEDIILNKYVDKNEFKYELRLNGLTAKQEENIINIYDGEEIKYDIEAPLMEDANGQMSRNIQLKLEETEGKTYITVIADKEWLKEEARAYPVKIDPTISTIFHEGESFFTTVEEYIPTLTIGDNGFCYVGYDNGVASGTNGAGSMGGHGITRIYTKFDIPDIPKDAQVTSATYNLYQASTFYTASGAEERAEIGLYSVAEDWDGAGRAWNDQPFDGQEFVDSKRVQSTRGYLEFNITELVNEWVQGIKPNKGICFKAISENTMQCEWIGSPKSASDYSPNHVPTMEIVWEVVDPVDPNLPLNDLNVNLRPMTEKDTTGKLRFDGVFVDGLSRPGTVVNFWTNVASDFYGLVYASGSYKYPDSSSFESTFPLANKYKNKLSNWQSGNIFTNPEFNKLYRVQAQATDGTEVSEEKQSDSFVVYQVKQRDTIPYIASYYGVPLNTIMRDNRVQDALLVENNTLFIRNPNKNAEKPYSPDPLTDKQKREIDGALRGRALHCEYGYEPINLNTGNFYMEKVDSNIPDLGGNFNISRTYNSKGEGYVGLFGKNWDFQYSEILTKLEDGTIQYSKGDGKLLFFSPDGNGGYTSPYGTELVIKETSHQGKIEAIEEENAVGEIVTTPEEVYTYYTYEITDKTINETRKFNSYGLLTNIVDSLGNDTKIEYNEDYEMTKITSGAGKVYTITMTDGKITAIALPNGGILKYEYDDNSNLVKSIDAEKNETRYEYNDKGQMTAWYNGEGVKVISNEYDGEGRVTKQYDGNNNVVTLAYENGKTISTDANGNVTNYYYNDRGYTTKIEHPDGSVETKEYDNDGNLTKATNGEGIITTFEYDSNRNCIKETRSNGDTKTAEYNTLNLPTKIVDFDGKVTSYTYDSKGNLLTETNNANQVKTYDYDNQNRVIKITDEADGVTKYTYTGANVTSITNAENQKTSYYYNNMNQVTSIKNQAEEVTRYTYNLNGDMLTEQLPDESTTTYIYDKASRQTAEIDANGNRTNFEYSNNDHVVKGVDPEGKPFTVEYDKNGNAIKETDANRKSDTI